MDHRPNEMSGGQQQRVGIARAFVTNPEVVFADEPTGNLDTKTTKEVMEMFLRFAREKGTTIILVTHDRSLAEYCDRIMIQDQGKMLILGTPEEVRNRGGKNLTMNEAFIAIVENSRRKEEL